MKNDQTNIRDESQDAVLTAGLNAYHSYLSTCSMKESGFMLNAMQAARVAMEDEFQGHPYLFSLAPSLESCTLDIGGVPYYFNAAPVKECIEDNEKHRALFTLPPIIESDETMPAVQALPSQQVVTGDKEIDAVLWLREVISTGQPGPIATALEAAKSIKTPPKDLDKRYSEYLMKASGGNSMAAVFGSFGFTDLENLAKRSLETAALATEARARFAGEAIWEDTPAEQFCEKALKRCKGFKDYINNDEAEVEKRFRKHADLMPHTLSDCLHEIAYWDHLQRLRSASGEWGDGQHEGIARCWFVERLLAVIPPRSLDEASAVLEYADTSEGMDHDQLIAIARNLIGDGSSRIVERKIET